MKLDKVIMDRTFKTIYEDGDNNVYVFKAETTKSAIFSEVLHQIKAEELGYRVPKVLDVDKVGDKWAVTTEKLVGENAYDVMVSSPERVDEILDRLINAQIEMHSIKCDIFMDIRHKFDDALVKADITAVGRFYLHGYLASLPRKHSMLHGDFNPKNLFLTDDGNYFVVDWKYTTIGDPLADVTVTYLELFLQFNEEMAEKYLCKYLAKTEIDRSEIEKWIPVCAAYISSRHQFDNEKELDRFLETY